MLGGCKFNRCTMCVYKTRWISTALTPIGKVFQQKYRSFLFSQLNGRLGAWLIGATVYFELQAWSLVNWCHCLFWTGLWGSSYKPHECPTFYLHVPSCRIPNFSLLCHVKFLTIAKYLSWDPALQLLRSRVIINSRVLIYPAPIPSNNSHSQKAKWN